MERVAWFGLDLHAHRMMLGWINGEGQRQDHWSFPTQERQLIEHLQRVDAKEKYLALEESGSGRWVAQVAKPHVTEVIVCDPRVNYHISRHHHKCDIEDAYRLAELHRLGALKRVWQPLDDGRAVFKSAAQAYVDAVDRQTALKLQLKAHFRQWGVMISGSGVYNLQKRQEYLKRVGPPGVRQQLELIYQMLERALEVESKARHLMVKEGQQYPEIQRLITVPGVGRIGAHLFVAYVQDPHRFQTPQRLFRYCRLGIRDRTSDGKPLGYQRLDGNGHGVLKSISYRAWLTGLRQHQGPVYQFFLSSLKRTTNRVHARLNTQRKILRTLWVLWIKDQEFDAKKFLGSETQPAA